jgi:RimJ/RimL family protein N-acetyltransferase
MKNLQNNSVTYRKLRIFDFIRLNTMYDELSDKSREFFNLYWLGFNKITLKWFGAQLVLFVSTFTFIKKIMYKVCPRLIFISQIAIVTSKCVGYSFLIVRKKSNNNRFEAEFGICISEKYQGMGIGKNLLQYALDCVDKEPIDIIYLNTRIDNTRALNLYKKFGFKVIKILENEVEWQDKKYDMYQMKKYFNHGN